MWDWLTRRRDPDDDYAPISSTATPAEKSANRVGRPNRAEAQRRTRAELTRLEELIALERARAEVRQLRLRGRKKPVAAATFAPPSAMSSAREQIDEALDLVDSLTRVGRNSEPQTVSAPPQVDRDAPLWERLLSSPAGLRLAESMAPTVAPILANMIGAATASASGAGFSGAPAIIDASAPVRVAEPTAEEESASVNLISAVVQYASLSPTDAAVALMDAARSQARMGNNQLLVVIGQAVKTPVFMVRLIANRYRSDPQNGQAIAVVLDTPMYLDSLLAALKAQTSASASASATGSPF